MNSSATTKESILTLVYDLLDEFYSFSLSDLSIISSFHEKDLLHFLMEFVDADLIQISVSETGNLMYERPE